MPLIGHEILDEAGVFEETWETFPDPQGRRVRLRMTSDGWGRIFQPAFARQVLGVTGPFRVCRLVPSPGSPDGGVGHLISSVVTREGYFMLPNFTDLGEAAQNETGQSIVFVVDEEYLADVRERFGEEKAAWCRDELAKIDAAHAAFLGRPATDPAPEPAPKGHLCEGGAHCPHGADSTHWVGE